MYLDLADSSITPNYTFKKKDIYTHTHNRSPTQTYISAGTNMDKQIQAHDAQNKFVTFLIRIQVE